MTEAIHISLDVVLGLFVGIVVPILLFWWRLHFLAKKIHDMHLEPDNYGFGTGETNALLSQHMATELEMHRKSINAIQYLTQTISELSYYVRWMAEEQTGKTPPPFVRNGRDPR